MTESRVHEVYVYKGEEFPLCYSYEMKAQGLEPDPEDWETSPEPILPGPYPLKVTCKECLEVIHA